MSPRFTLEDFVRESNRIEGIPQIRAGDLEAHEEFLALPPTLEHLCNFVALIAGAALRRYPGMNVRVGPHLPHPGGPKIEEELIALLMRSDLSPYQFHQRYETLHPFLDGNGRSGRALWLRQMGGIERAPLGFLHTWYYQSLQASRA